MTKTTWYVLIGGIAVLGIAAFFLLRKPNTSTVNSTAPKPTVNPNANGSEAAGLQDAVFQGLQTAKDVVFQIPVSTQLKGGTATAVAPSVGPTVATRRSQGHF